MCKFDLLTITNYTLDKKSLTSRSNYTRGIIDKLNNANFVNIRGVLGGFSPTMLRVGVNLSRFGCGIGIPEIAVANPPNNVFRHQSMYVQIRAQVHNPR